MRQLETAYKGFFLPETENTIYVDVFQELVVSWIGSQPHYHSFRFAIDLAHHGNLLTLLLHGLLVDAYLIDPQYASLFPVAQASRASSQVAVMSSSCPSHTMEFWPSHEYERASNLDVSSKGISLRQIANGSLLFQEERSSMTRMELD